MKSEHPQFLSISLCNTQMTSSILAFTTTCSNATLSYKGYDSRMVLTTFLSRLGCDMLLYHPIQNKNIETLKYSKPRGIPTCLWAHQLAKIGYYTFVQSIQTKSYNNKGTNRVAPTAFTHLSTTN